MYETEISVKSPTFVVAGGNYWGKGSTLKEAKRNFQKEGGDLAGGYTVLEFDPEAVFHGVDGLGRYTWDGNAPKQRDVPARRVH